LRKIQSNGAFDIPTPCHYSREEANIIEKHEHERNIIETYSNLNNFVIGVQ
jgi:hypothetical protein